MAQYRVTGTTKIGTKPGSPMVFGLNIIDRIVSAGNITEAKRAALLPYGVTVWHTGPDVVRVSLADLEQQTLADWNTGKPTASPLALAQARGEL